MLANYLELLKQCGFVTDFLELSHSKDAEKEQVAARKEVLVSKCKSKMHENEVSSVETSVPLSDSLVSESFLLLLYGISMATVTFIGETFAKNVFNVKRGFKFQKIQHNLCHRASSLSGSWSVVRTMEFVEN